MYVIIEYISGTSANLNFMVDSNGNTMLFDSEQEAEVFAEKDCAFNYKIVKL